VTLKQWLAKTGAHCDELVTGAKAVHTSKPPHALWTLDDYP
jgi:hypothetical protein